MVLRRRRWRALPAAGVCSILAAVLSACGGSAPNSALGSPLHAVLTSVTKTEAASSTALDLAITASGKIGSTPISLTISGNGAFNFVQHVGQFTVKIPALGNPSAAPSIVQLRIIGQTLYLNSASVAKADGGKPWASVSLPAYVKAEGQSTSGLGSLASGDPSQILGLIQRVGGSVTEVGPATVDGTPTTEYRANLDFAHLPTVTGSTLISPQELQQLSQALGQSSIALDVWVDGQDRTRQVQTQVIFLGLHVSATLGFGDFGAPVSVSAPPAGQTADGSGLLSSGQLSPFAGL